MTHNGRDVTHGKRDVTHHERGVTHRSEHPGPDSEILAAGAVLYRHAAGKIEVALIHRRRHDDWTFPKGKLEPGEHPLVAAVREATEETGIRTVLGRPLATVRYQAEGRPKRVDYWAALVDASAAPFVPNDEVDALAWLPSAEAAAWLTYAHDQRLLDLLLAPSASPSASSSPGAGFRPDNGAPPGADNNSITEAAGPGAMGDVLQPGDDTVPCILLRHGSAGRKGAWPGDDLLRPLDDQGVAEAQALAGLLACYAPTRVISSAAERCLATVRPYAERIGVPIETEPGFTVQPDNGEDRHAAARRRMAELLAHPSPMVICAHRENISALLDQVRATLPAVPMPAPSPGDPAWQDVEPHNSVSAADWSPPKGGFWVLHIANGQLSALEHHDLTS